MCTFKAIARSISTDTDRASAALTLELHQLSTIVRRANARAVLSRGSEQCLAPSAAAAEAAALLVPE